MAGPRTQRYYLLLHFIVILWGFTPILGKLISFDEYKLVTWRLMLSAPAVAVYLLIRKGGTRVSLNSLLQMLGIGILVSSHWIFFYGAIKVSNVSVTMAAFSCGALFTAFIEPLFYRRKIDRWEIVFGAVVIGAIAMITQAESGYALGVLMGVLAALGSSLFSVLNGRMVRKGNDPGVLTLVEMTGGLASLLMYGFFTGDIHSETFAMNPVDLGWLLVLSLICTAFTFIASVEVMKEVSPYTVNLTVNLESVYAIILAYFIFGKSEQMSMQFYFGALLILCTVLANGWLKFYRKK
ncbi:MAG: DMT family transporter [Bacteroidia bacterium]|nr:DMT family transporter [Bacteroidia bacterium]